MVLRNMHIWAKNKARLVVVQLTEMPGHYVQYVEQKYIMHHNHMAFPDGAFTTCSKTFDKDLVKQAL